MIKTQGDTVDWDGKTVSEIKFLVDSIKKSAKLLKFAKALPDASIYHVLLARKAERHNTLSLLSAP